MRNKLDTHSIAVMAVDKEGLEAVKVLRLKRNGMLGSKKRIRKNFIDTFNIYTEELKVL